MNASAIHTRTQRRLRIDHLLQRVLTHTLLIVGAAFVLLPFYWLLRSSLMMEGDFFVWPPILWPTSMVWRNYVDIFQVSWIPVPVFFKNSVILVVAAGIGDVFSASVVGFSLGRLRWWGRKAVFAALIATMFLPYQVTIIPLFLGFHRLGMLNTLWPMIIPSWIGHALYVFLVRQFVMRIPLELDDAMRIDGASTFRIYWSLILPLSKPALITIAIFSFQQKWNQFFQPLLYISDENVMPLAVGLRMLRSVLGHGTVETPLGWNHVMAASVLMMMPVAIVFFVAQRAFIQGIATSGLKG